jgi:hypothetical protein
MGTLQSDEDSRMWERGREAGTTNAGNIEHRACCIRSGWNKVAKFEVPCQWKGVCCRGASRQQLPKPPRACLIALSHPWCSRGFPTVNRNRTFLPRPQLAPWSPPSHWIPLDTCRQGSYRPPPLRHPLSRTNRRSGDQTLNLESTRPACPGWFLLPPPRAQASIHDEDSKSERLFRNTFFADNKQFGAISNASLYHQYIV